MFVPIVPIGSSKGIRIPNYILKDLSIKDKIELVVNKNEIILKAVKKNIRKNWIEAFQKMHLNGDDKLVISENIDTERNWEWI